MAHVGPEDAEKQALVAFLDAQRAIVLAIVAGARELTDNHTGLGQRYSRRKSGSD